MKKKAVWLIGSLVACGLWMLPSQIQAMDWEGTGEIFCAHRKDRITSLLHVYNLPATLALRDNVVAKNIHVVEGGLRGKIELCNGVFFKGFGSFGAIDYGIYAESTQMGVDPKVMSRAKFHHGNVQDWSLGLGYQYQFSPMAQAGISAGWAYDAQSFRLGRVFFKTSEPFIRLVDYELKGLRYKMHWQGPWIGLETRVYLPLTMIDLGYEFHWTHWHADWKLKRPDVAGGSFSDRRKSDQNIGNVAFINVTYQFFKCWTIAIGARYNYFQTLGGHAKPTAADLAALGLGDTEIKVKKATWQSFAMQLFFGYSF